MGRDPRHCRSGEWEFNNNVLQTSSSGNPPASFYPANLAAIGFEDTDNGIFKLSSGSNYKTTRPTDLTRRELGRSDGIHGMRRGRRLRRFSDADTDSDTKSNSDT